MEKFNRGDRVTTSFMEYGVNHRGTIIDRKIWYYGGYYLYTIMLDKGKEIKVLSPYVYRVYEDENTTPSDSKKK